MNRPAATGLTLALSACVAAVSLSVRPGGLEAWIIPLLFLAIPAFPIVLLVVVIQAVSMVRRAGKKAPGSHDDPTGDDPEALTRPSVGWPSWKRAIVIGLIAGVVSLALIVTRVPTRLAFAASRPAFEAARGGAPWNSKGPRVDASQSRRIGWFQVDRYAKDPRGGDYFRTGTSPDIIDTVSHGFVHRPNRLGTPFGRSHYHVWHLVGDWYVFSASDDSH